jgi:hypothetical protein
MFVGTALLVFEPAAAGAGIISASFHDDTTFDTQWRVCRVYGGFNTPERMTVSCNYGAFGVFMA